MAELTSDWSHSCAELALCHWLCLHVCMCARRRTVAPAVVLYFCIFVGMFWKCVCVCVRALEACRANISFSAEAAHQSVQKGRRPAHTAPSGETVQWRQQLQPLHCTCSTAASVITLCRRYISASLPSAFKNAVF